MRAAPTELIFAIVLTTIVAAPTAAQTAAVSFADLQGRLKPDQTVYVQTAEVADERGIKGKVLELSGSTLRLLVNGQRREFSERDVLVVSERHTSARKGALIGLAVGGGLGLWGGASCCGYATLGLMVGAGFGTLVGGVVGDSIKHERVLFLAHDLQQSRSFSMTPFVGQDRKGLAATFRF
jgi:hypothetical protein